MGALGQGLATPTPSRPPCTVNEGDPYVAVSWTDICNPARGRGRVYARSLSLSLCQNPYVKSRLATFC